MINLNWKLIEESYNDLIFLILDASFDDFNGHQQLKQKLNTLTHELLRDQEYKGEYHSSIKYILIKMIVASCRFELTDRRSKTLMENLKEALKISWTDDATKIIESDTLHSQIKLMNAIYASKLEACSKFRDEDGKVYKVGYYIKRK